MFFLPPPQLAVIKAIVRLDREIFEHLLDVTGMNWRHIIRPVPAGSFPQTCGNSNLLGMMRRSASGAHRLAEPSERRPRKAAPMQITARRSVQTSENPAPPVEPRLRKAGETRRGRALHQTAQRLRHRPERRDTGDNRDLADRIRGRAESGGSMADPSPSTQAASEKTQDPSKPKFPSHAADPFILAAAAVLGPAALTMAAVSFSPVFVSVRRDHAAFAIPPVSRSPCPEA
ncbi:MAG: hypothetical protein R6V26_09515 [Roseovarius sp.]